MQIRFWGVRGSVPSPGPLTQRTGGNTSCVEVLCGNRRIVLDAGTGLRNLGDQLTGKADHQVTLLLSHLHWDHIQGLPFFGPLYRPGTELSIYGPSGSSAELSQALTTQMSAPSFPIKWQELPSSLSTLPLLGGEAFWLDDVKISCARLNHPGGVLGYRIEYGGKSVVYATDTEHYACDDPKLLALARDADVLIYDSMYTEAEYRGDRGPSRVGWGHSTWEAGARIAERASVSDFVLFHHDPGRDDDQVDALEGAARHVLPRSQAAREGLVLSLGMDDGQRAA